MTGAGRALLGPVARAAAEWVALSVALEGVVTPCQSSDAEAWWPEPATHPEEVAMALRGCEVCPVRVECLAYAVAAGERAGIWGGVRFARAARAEREAS